MKKFLILGASTLLMATSGLMAASGASGLASAQPTKPAPAPTDASTYVAKAGASDLWEIESSKALLAKSGNAEVRKFAQMMIDQHGQSTVKIKTAAAAAKIQVAPPKLDANQQKMLDEIKQADAAAIDALYIRHQRTAHNKALALHKAYGANGDKDALKKTANEIVSVVEMHRSHLDKLATQPQR